METRRAAGATAARRTSSLTAFIDASDEVQEAQPVVAHPLMAPEGSGAYQRHARDVLEMLDGDA
jgi:hypothetical protein